MSDISLNVEFGDKVVLSGDNGSGKSTLFRLISGDCNGFQGEVYINGRSIKEYRNRWISKEIALAEQSEYIFSGTVLENIRLGNLNAPLEEILTVAKVACVDDFVQTLPEKYEYHLDENGSGLSVGQRQRICIARALLRDASILLMDEATSALDVNTEESVMKNIISYCKDRTVIMISHRKTEYFGFNRFLKIYNGHIEEINV